MRKNPCYVKCVRDYNNIKILVYIEYIYAMHLYFVVSYAIYLWF